MAKAGRKSQYHPSYAKLAFKFALLGAIDADLARCFEVSQQTINAWKKAYPAFLESIKKGKAIADAEVASKLYHRATGYDCKATKFATYEGKITDKQDYIEHYPPDTTAAIFWLKNRRKEEWREKTEQEIDLKQPVIVEIVRFGEKDKTPQ